jgi:hypothetical protein
MGPIATQGSGFLSNCGDKQKSIIYLGFFVKM